MVWYLQGGGGGGFEDNPNDHDPYSDPWQQPVPVTPNVPAVPPETPATTPAETPATGGGGGGVGAPAFTPSGFPGGSPTRRVPTFTAPKFIRPSAEDMLNSPAYQFRVQQGQQGIERSAAARGLLRTGGTLKDIADYNQNFASNEYGNEFNRALQTFGTQYQGAKDEYAPLLAEWSTLANADLQRALAAYGRDTIWYNPNQGGGGGGSSPIILPPPSPPS